MTSTMIEYKKRRAMMLKHLGNQCCTCASSEDLEFDHVDPKIKSFDISANWSLSWSVLVIELNKCQLLCKSCHYEKSVAEGSIIPPRGHGTPRKYRNGCRCADCTAANSKYQKLWREGKLKKAMNTSGELFELTHKL